MSAWGGRAGDGDADRERVGDWELDGEGERGGEGVGERGGRIGAEEGMRSVFSCLRRASGAVSVRRVGYKHNFSHQL